MIDEQKCLALESDIDLLLPTRSFVVLGVVLRLGRPFLHVDAEGGDAETLTDAMKHSLTENLDLVEPANHDVAQNSSSFRAAPITRSTEGIYASSICQ